jgi:hypothetical protein
VRGRRYAVGKSILGGWEFTRSRVPGSDTAEEFSGWGLRAGKGHHIPIGEDRCLGFRKVSALLRREVSARGINQGVVNIISFPVQGLLIMMYIW